MYRIEKEAFELIQESEAWKITEYIYLCPNRHIVHTWVKDSKICNACQGERKKLRRAEIKEHKI